MTPTLVFTLSHSVTKVDMTVHEKPVITYGALLIGSCFASIYSGVVFAQSVMYYKLFPDDHIRLKYTVLTVWLLDLAHSAIVWTAMWDYMITNFGISDEINHISLCIALNVILTAVLTVVTHSFFIHRIHQLSNRNFWITTPLAILVLLRLVTALVTSAEMMRLHLYNVFRDEFRWLFSLGLVVSTVLDVAVTVLLIVLLRSAQKHALSMEDVIDKILLYTVEVGSLTTITAITTLCLWLSMNHSLIFLGFYFTLAKLYANSLLATLNSRKVIQQVATGSRAIMFDIQPGPGVGLPFMNFAVGSGDPNRVRNLPYPRLADVEGEVHLRSAAGSDSEV